MLSVHFWACGHDTCLYITCSACVVNITMLNTKPVYCTRLVCKSYLSVLGTIIVTYMAHISCNFMRSVCVCVSFIISSFILWWKMCMEQSVLLSSTLWVSQLHLGKMDENWSVALLPGRACRGPRGRAFYFYLFMHAMVAGKGGPGVVPLTICKD